MPEGKKIFIKRNLSKTGYSDLIYFLAAVPRYHCVPHTIDYETQKKYLDVKIRNDLFVVQQYVFQM